MIDSVEPSADAIAPGGCPAPGAPPAALAEPPRAFDVAALTRLLDGRHHPLRQRVRRLLAAPEFAYLQEAERGAYREQVLAWCRRLAAEGLGALALPTEYGGRANPGAFVAAFETLAHHDLSLLVKFGVQFGLFAGAIQQLGTARHHRAYLGAAGRLELPGCFAMTETCHGSNVQAAETAARFDRATGELVLTTPHRGARKDYIGNAALHGRVAVVFAQLVLDGESRGVHAFVVPIRDAGGRPLPGVGIEDCGEKLGLNGVDNGRLWFEGVRLPREALLDRFARLAADGTYTSPIESPGRRFFAMLGTLVGGRVSIALAALSATKSALTIAVRYAARRRQFGPEAGGERVLLDYLTHQRRLLVPLAAVYAQHFALHELARRYAAGAPGDEERREVEMMAAGLKAVATAHATATIQACREACGGQGYLAENRLAALKADSDVFTTFEGDNTVLLQLVAKGLLSELRHELEELTLFGLVRLLAERATRAVAEHSPVASRRTDPDHLRDPELHAAAFRSREEHLVVSLARRIKKRIEDGMDPFAALTECQDHALAAARAYVERVVFAAFHGAVTTVDDPSLAEPLVLLRDLYALERLESDRAWFLEHGLFEPAKSEAVRKEVNRLCGELRRHALPLVEAFAIPAASLAAPIAA